MSIEWRERAGEIWTVPNLISLSRLPLVAGIAVTLDSPVRYVLFALIILSDGIDGWVARKLDQTTELGAMLDPALDKLTALIVVAILFPRLDLPLAYLVLFFARDAFVVSLAPLVPLYGFDTSKVQARLPGKVVTNLQFLAMVAMLVPAVAATETLLWALALASAAAITDYVVFVARELSGRPWVHDRRGLVAAAVAVAAAFALVVGLLLYGELADWLAALG
ncbi:CDP-alcohol phosphatidyltransferase family protein [Halosimplex sp. TS25]|uniref:CDP-alcohol phosphatidyltransferase family protein n=1 Tax=Halosimplex rarum TaxID=3396619 RepID=UPI0039E926C1